MKLTLKLLVITFVVILTVAMKPTPKRVLFFGDSITQQGLRPMGYISQLKKMIDTNKFELVGAGIGGNKVTDLYLRLEDDVLTKKPDIVFIYVGINDIWHKELSKTGTDYTKYIKFYQAIINKLKANGAQVVLCTPSIIGEKNDGSNLWDGELDQYADGIRNLVLKNNLQLCDLRKAFKAYEIQYNTANLEAGVLTGDKVHLNNEGNKLVAQQMLPFIK